MKALHTRLDPVKDEILDCTRAFGRFRAMSKYHVLSYDRFSNWLEEVTGEKNFGLIPVISSGSDQTLGDQLVQAFLRKVADLETSLAERNKRIHFLEWQLGHTREKEDQQALAVLETCEP